jgi:hypothetical protein
MTSKARDNVEKLKNALSVMEFGATGDGTTDDTTALQAAINAAFDTGVPLYVPPAKVFYRVTQTLVCNVAAPTDRQKGLRIYGQNHGNPFTHPSALLSSSIQGAMNAPVLKLTGYTIPTGRTVSINLEGLVIVGNSASHPVVLLEGMYASEFRDFVIYQYGDGDGLRITYSVTSVIEDGYIINADATTAGLGASRTGVGLSIEMESDGALGLVKRVTSRGFKTGFETGNTSSPGISLNMLFEDCEASYTFDNVILGPKARYSTINRLYSEGNEGGTVVKMDGFFNRVTNSQAFGGAAVGVDFLPNSKACLALNNNLDVGTDGVFSPTNPIGLRLRGVQNKAAYNHFRQSGSIANSIGLRMENATTSTATKNTFEPGTWLGSGSAPIADATVSSVNAASGTLIGVVQQPNIANNFVFESLQSVAVSHYWDDTVLTQTSVDNTPRTDTLHLSEAAVMKFTPSSAVNVRAFEAKNLFGKQFWLLATNNNATFVNNDWLRTHTKADYTPPAGGAWMSFIVSSNGVAILQFVTELDLTLTTIS